MPSLGLGLGGGLGLGLGLAPDEGGLGGGDTEQQGEDLHSGSVGWRSLPACTSLNLIDVKALVAIFNKEKVQVGAFSGHCSR